MDFRQLRYFVATAEYGQISHAAVSLSISQSAVTAAIKDLELTVGVGRSAGKRVFDHNIDTRYRAIIGCGRDGALHGDVLGEGAEAEEQQGQQ